jgi:hypothetical protein
MNSITGQREDHLETAALYVLQVLAPGETADFEGHLSGCEECRQEIESLRSVIDSFAEWPTDILRPPASLWTRLSQRVADESGAEPVSPPARPFPRPQWQAAAVGILCKLLAVDAAARRVTLLVRLAAGTDYPPHRHAGVEELHLLHGELMIDDRKIYAGDYVRAGAGTVDHRIWSETGCTCLLMTSTDDAILKFDRDEAGDDVLQK